MKLQYARFLVASACALATTPALADEPPPLPPPTTAETPAAASATVDAVHLRNGGLYRGHVTEIVPGDHVTILVEKGEPKRIAWAEIDRVVVATTPVPPPPGGSGEQVGARTIPSATAPTPAPMNGPKARVHITSSSTVVLYRRVTGSTAWTMACTSPCNEMLPLGDSYRVNGNGVAQSAEFTLQGSPNSTIDLKVDGQSTGGMVLGGTLAAIGAMVGYVGLLVVAVTLDKSNRSDDEARAGGLVAMGLGAVAALGGVLVFLASAKTDVTQNQTGGGGRGNDAWRRLPTWRTAERGAPAQFPIVFSHAF
ncbi:MAG: hypothetical protein U0270_06810 [Labilithrix sp.]